MASAKIPPMTRPTAGLTRGNARDQRLSGAIRARRRLHSPRGGGRAWINGREVGGSDPRYAHLSRSYD